MSQRNPEKVANQGLSGTNYKRAVKKFTNRWIRRQGKRRMDADPPVKQRKGWAT